MSKANFKVSIVVVTYNHEKFIGKTLDNILTQDVNFNYEIIIGDDNSTDRTVSILQEYKKRHNGVITLLLADKNEGPFKNGHKAYKQCKGEFVTWIDGDDYWNNPKKLQIQVDFLEANADYAGCFHDARIEQELEPSTKTVVQTAGDYKYYSQFNEYKLDFHPWDLLKRNIIPTASLLFRNTIELENVPGMDAQCLSLNWALQLMIIKDSKFRYFNEAWSVYNNHSEGISKTRELNDFKESNVAIIKSLLKDRYYRGLKADLYQSMASEYLQILLNPETIKKSRGYFLGVLFKYIYACIKTAIAIASGRSKQAAELSGNK